MSVGSLYEYFPNKEALLLALAERHVALGEERIEAALAAGGTTRELLAAVQAAVLESQRYPSHALALVADVPRVGPELQRRVARLQRRLLDGIERHLRAHRPALSEPALRARAAFGAIAELTARAVFESPDQLKPLARHYLEMAIGHLGG